jgi:hypothetical protein
MSPIQRHAERGLDFLPAGTALRLARPVVGRRGCSRRPPCGTIPCFGAVLLEHRLRRRRVGWAAGSCLVHPDDGRRVCPPAISSQVAPRDPLGPRTHRHRLPYSRNGRNNPMTENLSFPREHSSRECDSRGQLHFAEQLRGHSSPWREVSRAAVSPRIIPPQRGWPKKSRLFPGLRRPGPNYR